MEDLSNNYVWLAPWCQQFPKACPSGFFIGDVLLCLDEKLEGKLIVPPGRKAGDPPCARAMKVELVKEDVNRLKKLIGALRYLWRNGVLVFLAPNLR